MVALPLFWGWGGRPRRRRRQMFSSGALSQISTDSSSLGEAAHPRRLLGKNPTHRPRRPSSVVCVGVHVLARVRM